MDVLVGSRRAFARGRWRRGQQSSATRPRAPCLPALLTKVGEINSHPWCGERFASCWASGRSWTLGWIQSNMNPNQLVPPASLGKSERSDRSKKVSLQPARLREFDNRILCCTKRFYAYWLTKSVTAAVDGRGRRLKSATRGLRSVWGAKNSRGLVSPAHIPEVFNNFPRYSDENGFLLF